MPGQFTVHHNTQIFFLGNFRQLVLPNMVCKIERISSPCDTEMFTFVSIESHAPEFTPSLNLKEVVLKDPVIFRLSNFSVAFSVISVKRYCSPNS